MKPEEAIEILQERINLIKQDWPYMHDLVEYHKVLELAVKALKKQIPKKVLYEDVGFDCHCGVNLSPAYARRVDCISLIFRTMI